MEDNKFDEIFNDEKLNRAIKRVRRKTAIRTIIISLIVTVVVFLVGGYANFRISLKMSEKLYNSQVAETKLTVPNGYISKTADSLGFLGGKSNYQISKDVGGRSIVMSSNNIVPFGIFPNYSVYHRTVGGGSATTNGWQDSFWENGERKMVFFHPEIQYKEYRNDLNILNELPDDKIIEMGISFDKPYKISEVSSLIPDAKISWYWIDAFTKEDFENYTKAAKEYDPKSAFLWEFQTIGVSSRGGNIMPVRDFYDFYKDVLQYLQDSRWNKHHEIYNELIKKGYDDPEKVPVLGVIVYGTKDELKKLVGNPHIKASSIGVTIDKY